MTIHFTLIFVLLMVEMVVFTVLLLPMPLSFRRALLKWISTSSLVARVQYILKILFVFVFILFLDSLNRALKADPGSDDEDAATHIHHHSHASDLQFQLKVFRAQRNMYLTGFTLFLSLILNRFITMISQMVKYEEQLEVLKKQALNNSKEYMRLSEEKDGAGDELEELRQRLAKSEEKSKQLDAVLKQSKGSNEEYMRLADRYNELEKKFEGRDPTEAKKSK